MDEQKSIKTSSSYRAVVDTTLIGQVWKRGNTLSLPLLIAQLTIYL